jgi:hypothetical protein
MPKQPTREKRIETINGLLAKARDSATTEAEARIYASHAAKLMARHAIQPEDLDDARGLDGVTERVITVQAPFAQEKIVLIAHIAAALHCRSVHLRHKIKQVPSGALVMGTQVDIDRVETLYETLSVVAHNALATDAAGRDFITEKLYQRYARNWFAAYSQAVGIRLDQIERHTAAEVQQERDGAEFDVATGERRLPAGPSTELVLRTRDQDAEDYYKQRFPDIDKVDYRPPSMFDYGAVDGNLAGRRADIGLTKVEGGTWDSSTLWTP